MGCDVERDPSCSETERPQVSRGIDGHPVGIAFSLAVAGEDPAGVARAQGEARGIDLGQGQGEEVEPLNQVEATVLSEFFPATAPIAADALRLPPWDADISKLSGGEKRRVALCRLLLSRPDMLVCDTDLLVMIVWSEVRFDDEESSPGIKRGGVLNVVRHELELICDAAKIPDEIHISLAGLDIGDSLHISAVTLPEIFLKAVTVVRNLGFELRDFTTANFDFIQHYRPQTNVVSRPVAGIGKGYSLVGHHEILIPLLAAALRAQRCTRGSMSLRA